jgi:hypothetical protein
VRDFVARVAPSAEYAGGRIEADDSGQSRYVMYFVDPSMAPCVYKKFESAPDDATGTRYVVLVAGEESFDKEQFGRGEAGCLPKL